MVQARAKHPDVADQLRRAIRTCGVSLNQLAAATGVHKAQLSRFLRAERTLTLKAAAKVCSHRRLYDLAGAVEKLPRLLPENPSTAALQATGTDNTSATLDGLVCTGFVQTHDPKGDYLRLIEAPKQVVGENAAGLNALILQGVEAGCDRLILAEAGVGDRTRTGDNQIHSLEL